MGKGTTGWGKQIAVALVYMLLYVLVRPLSGGIWSITTGLRLSALFFVPYRFWPALAIGELVPLTFVNLQCLPQFGATWVILQSIPPMLYTMPIVHWFREKRDLFPSRKTVNLKQLLLCVGAVCLTWTATVLLFNLTSKLQPPHAVWKMIVAMLLGKYVGILTILPLGMMAWMAYRSNQLQNFNVRTFFNSRLFIETALFTLPIIVCIGLLQRHANADMLAVLQVIAFIPVSLLTVRNGWRGSALGTALVMACIFLNTKDSPDDVIPLQALIAFASTALIALGANVTTQEEISERERIKSLEATKVAQQALYLSELRLKQIAFALESIGSNLNLTQTRLLSKFKHVMPLSENQLVYKQASSAKEEIYKLANSIHPIDWRDNGLPYVLRQTIARVCDESGISYSCELEGPLSDLSTHVHVAVYRLINEAIVYACVEQNCTRVNVKLRGGYTNHQRWVVMRLRAERHPITHANDPVFKRENFSRKLGAHGLSVPAMRDSARLYDGEMHLKHTSDQLMLTALLHDHTATEKKRKQVTVSASSSTGRKWLLLR